jgi:hypothetical protein
MDEIRDHELGEQLQVLAEPDHGPGYWDQVRRQVADAAAERQPRPGLGLRLREAFGRRRLRIAIAAAAFAAVAAAAVLFGLPRTSGPPAVSAAEVLQRALGAYSSGRTWQADAVLKGAAWNRSGVGYHYDVWRYHVVQSAGGSYRLTLTGQTQTGAADTGARLRVKDDLAYDASTGVLRHLRPGRELVVVTDYPLGPPDRWASPLTGVDFGATLRAMMAAGALKLEETALDGRPAWTVVTSQGAGVASPAGSAQGIDWPVYKVTVDRKTWLPVRFQEVRAGTLTAELRVRNVAVNEPLPEQVFTLRPLKGLPTRHADRGFRRVALDQVRTFPAVTPLVPGYVPSGYRLARVAVAARALTTNHMFRARHVFALQYTHGFDALTVSTRKVVGAYFSATDDPVDSYDPQWTRLVRTEVEITSGAFAGTTASIVVATTSSAPHLWAVKDGVLLTIAGGATAKELLAIANSLHVYPGASTD